MVLWASSGDAISISGKFAFNINLDYRLSVWTGLVYV